MVEIDEDQCQCLAWREWSKPNSVFFSNLVKCNKRMLAYSNCCEMFRICNLVNNKIARGEIPPSLLTQPTSFIDQSRNASCGVPLACACTIAGKGAESLCPCKVWVEYLQSFPEAIITNCMMSVRKTQSVERHSCTLSEHSHNR